MKKFLKALTAALAVVVLAVALVGCTANVSGKTYAYSEVVATIPDDASTIEQGLITTAKGVVEKAFQNAQVTFEEDGKVKDTASTWTQDGKTVTVKTGDTVTTTFNVNGKKLEQTYQQGNYTFTVVFVQK